MNDANFIADIVQLDDVTVNVNDLFENIFFKNDSIHMVINYDCDKSEDIIKLVRNN